MKAIPARYADYFRQAETPSGEEAWRCRLCQRLINRNALAAQSHVAMHVRAIRERLKVSDPPAAPELAQLLRYPLRGQRRKR